MQTMELDRINEMEKFIQTYTNAVKTLTETMNQVIIQKERFQIVENRMISFDIIKSSIDEVRNMYNVTL
jgi:hypothetical protein